MVIAGTTFDNANRDGCADDDADPNACSQPGEDFIIHPDSDRTPNGFDRFNDRLAFLTVDELMEAVQRRVLGDAVDALKTYRDAHGRYPWLSPFENPRERAGGHARKGSRTQLTVGSETDLVGAGVRAGDVVVNLADRASAIVTAVAPQSISFSNALSAGSAFSAGEPYTVRAPFNAT